MTKEQGGQKNGIVKANKKHIFHSPRGFFSLKKHFQKKFREGGRKSKGNTQNRYKKKRGGGSDKDGDTQTNQHTPPTHSPPGDEGCYCLLAACSIDKHPLPVPLPDHATQRTKSATKLQLIQDGKIQTAVKLIVSSLCPH